MRLSVILQLGAATIAAFLAQRACAADQPQRDSSIEIQLSEKLNEMGNYLDYSVYLLDGVLKTNPPDADRVKIQKARTLFKMNKVEEGEAIINSIKKESKFFADSRFALGELLFRKKKEKEAAQAFEEYFAVYSKPENLPKDKAGKEQYSRGCMVYLKQLYTNTGDKAGLDRVFKYYDALTDVKKTSKSGEEGAADQAGDEAEGKLMKLQMRVDAAEKMKLDGKDCQKDVDALRKELKDLFWRGGADMIAALAYIEDARCLILLGRQQDAVNLLSENKATFAAFTEPLAKDKQAHWSPEAFAVFFEAKANLDLANAAKKAGKADEALDLYAKALKGFVRHILKFHENARAGQSLSLMNECKSILEKDYGKKIELPKLPNIKGLATESPEVQRAKSLRDDNKFDEAIKILLSEYPKSKSLGETIASDLLYNLVYCCIKAGRTMEANAIANHLVENYETFERAPDTLVMVGEAYKKEKKGEEMVAAFESYLMRYPTHQYAGAIATIIARDAYNEACKIGVEANKMQAGQEKNDKNKKAREMFAGSIPLFARIVNNYAGNPEFSNQAYYFLGKCHSNAEDYAKAGEACLEYCAKETDPAKLSQVADTKFLAGHSYFQEADLHRKNFEKLKKEKETIEAGSDDDLDAATPVAGTAKIEASAATDTSKTDGKAEDKVAETADKDGKKDKSETEKASAEGKEKAKIPQAEDTPEMKLERELGVKYYNLSIQNIEELIKPWEKIAKDASNEKTQKNIQSGDQLLGWVYDGLASLTTEEQQRKGYLQKAQDALRKFNTKYPDSKKVPGSMQRIGTIYAELGDFQSSAKVLDELSQKYPDSEEGKKALMTLARSMHKIGNYQKAIETVNKMFETKTDLTTKNLRWIASNLWQCGKERPKDAAELSYKASQIILDALSKKPVIEDWLTKAEQFEAQNDPKKIEKKLNDRKEQVLCNAGEAAFWAEKYDDGIKLLTDLLSAPKTPYYFKAKFLRADTYAKKKDYQNAISDYGDVGGPGTDKESVRWDAGLRVGKVYLEQNMVSEAKSAFHIIAITPLDQDESESLKKVTKEEQDAQKRFMEDALYYDALCASRLGESDIVKEMSEKYKKYYPDGKYIKKFESLPPADAKKPEAAAPAKAEDKKGK